jgi:hypothetical protein
MTPLHPGSTPLMGDAGGGGGRIGRGPPGMAVMEEEEERGTLVPDNVTLDQFMVRSRCALFQQCKLVSLSPSIARPCATTCDLAGLHHSTSSCVNPLFPSSSWCCSCSCWWW